MQFYLFQKDFKTLKTLMFYKKIQIKLFSVVGKKNIILCKKNIIKLYELLRARCVEVVVSTALFEEI